MLDAMVAARLLVADRAEDGTPVVRVAHEALLDRWPRVAAWLEEDREFLRVRTRVAEGAARWREEARRPDLLLPPGKPLAEAEALVTDRAEELDPGAVEYVAASSSARRRRRRTQALVAVLIAMGVTAAARSLTRNGTTVGRLRSLPKTTRKLPHARPRSAASFRPRIASSTPATSARKRGCRSTGSCPAPFTTSPAGNTSALTPI